METTTPEPTPIFWDNSPAEEIRYQLNRKDLYQHPTTDEYGMTYAKEHDGEALVVVGIGKESGLPVVLFPADHVTPETNVKSRPVAEDLDLKCTEAAEQR
ncbi:hypothetical protein [Paenarthrobacter sp. NPDC057981]|uniref:hypothetical protein n=1 Tax=Paenarthrobacter sp. NPDC057981 TaxID=3346297 RepID=UPI0036D99DD8